MIWISDEWKDYEVLDTSCGERLERWGKYLMACVCPSQKLNAFTENTHVNVLPCSWSTNGSESSTA